MISNCLNAMVTTFCTMTVAVEEATDSARSVSLDTTIPYTPNYSFMMGTVSSTPMKVSVVEMIFMMNME